MTRSTTIALTLEGDQGATTAAVKWLVKRLLRTFGVRVIACRIVDTGAGSPSPITAAPSGTEKRP